MIQTIDENNTKYDVKEIKIYKGINYNFVFLYLFVSPVEKAKSALRCMALFKINLADAFENILDKQWA